MHIVPASSYRRMPWKNGGGETIEIAASPQSTSLDAFDWRVSMARVAAPGPFSIFPQVDRTLAVLEGAALLLRFSPDETVRLTPQSAPFAFAADRPFDASLEAGSITDLNVMSRRGRIRHSLQRLTLTAPIAIADDAEESLLFVHAGHVRVESGSGALTVAAGDALLTPRANALVAPLSATATVFLAAFSPH
jgi:uncharacterized protein